MHFRVYPGVAGKSHERVDNAQQFHGLRFGFDEAIGPDRGQLHGFRRLHNHGVCFGVHEDQEAARGGQEGSARTPRVYFVLANVNEEVRYKY